LKHVVNETGTTYYIDYSRFNDFLFGLICATNLCCCFLKMCPLHCPFDHILWCEQEI
jgi:hypothetical protein